MWMLGVRALSPRARRFRHLVLQRALADRHPVSDARRSGKMIFGRGIH